MKQAWIIGYEGRLGPVWMAALTHADIEVAYGLGLPGWDIRTSTIPAGPMPEVLVINAGVDDRPGSSEPWPKYDTARALGFSVRRYLVPRPARRSTA